VSDLRTVVKAHDIRGLVPEQSDEAACVALGAAFVSVVGAVRIVVGRDCGRRALSLSAAFAASACGWGAEVLDVGLASTDLLYDTSSHLSLPAAMFTASHNPAADNGIKLCGAGAAPISRDTGLADSGRHPADLTNGGSRAPRRRTACHLGLPEPGPRPAA
jgi:phosphomannomutase